MTALATRDDYLTAYADATPGDLAFALLLAENPDEIDAAAHLSLVLFGIADCGKPVVEHGMSFPSLTELVGSARARLDPDVRAEQQRIADRINEASRIAAGRRKTEAQLVRTEREDRITRLGFNNAVPPRGRP